MAKKRILMIVPSPLYLEKGSSLRSYGVSEILSEKYFLDIVMYNMGSDFTLQNTNIHRTFSFYSPVLQVGKPSFSKVVLDFFLFFKSFHLILSKEYDIIHCEDFEGAFIGYILSFFFPNKKMVYNLHNRIEDNLYQNNERSIIIPFALFFEKLIVKRMDLVILNWEKYSKDEIFKKKKKFLFYDKISLEDYPCNLPSNKYIIYAGNFRKVQGISEFLEGFMEIKMDVKLVLVGSLSKEIKNQIEQKNLKDRVLILGKLPLQKTNYLIKNSLFAVLPRLKGAAMKMINYLMLSKIILAKDTVYSRELLKDNFNSFLYKDKEDLKKKLNFLLDGNFNESSIKEGIEETKKKIIKNWSTERFLKEYEK